MNLDGHKTKLDGRRGVSYTVSVKFDGRGFSKLPVIELQLPGDLDYRELVTRTVSLVCKLATGTTPGVNAEFTNELTSAVGEAFNNIAIHGFRDLEAKQVTIVVSFDDERVRVELMDHGHSFAPDEIGPPDLTSLPESGMGLFIMRSFVDKLEYVSGSPNVLALTKYIGRGRATGT